MSFSSTENLYRDLDRQMSNIRFGLHGFSGGGLLSNSTVSFYGRDANGKGVAEGKSTKEQGPVTSAENTRAGFFAYGNGKFGQEGVGTFLTRGAKFGHDGFVGGVGVNAEVTSRLAATFNYNVSANNDSLGYAFE